MRIEYAPELLERTVRAAAHGDARLDRELHTHLDPVYEIDDEERRESEFRQVFARIFGRLNLDRELRELIVEQPLISRYIEHCVIRPASRSQDEGAELFLRREEGGREPARTVVLSIYPESLMSFDQFAGRMRRELIRIADLLDPAFKHTPSEPTAERPQHNLICDRYRVLWDLTIESRLAGPGRLPSVLIERFACALAKLCGGIIDDSSAELVRHLASIERPTHPSLLKWAQDPATLPHGLPRDSNHSAQ